MFVTVKTSAPYHHLTENSLITPELQSMNKVQWDFADLEHMPDTLFSLSKYQWGCFWEDRVKDSFYNLSFWEINGVSCCLSSEITIAGHWDKIIGSINCRSILLCLFLCDLLYHLGSEEPFAPWTLTSAVLQYSTDVI